MMQKCINMAYNLLVKIVDDCAWTKWVSFYQIGIKIWTYKYPNYRAKLNYHILNAVLFSLVKENSTLYLILFSVYFISN